MAQAPVPSYDDFMLNAPKPEAFSKIRQEAIERVLRNQTDVAAAYYGDLATLPLVKVCGGFEDAVVGLAARRLMSHRGYNPEAGADSAIKAAYDDAVRWLKGVRDKEIQPFFVDSKPGKIEDSGELITYERSDEYVRGRDPQGIRRRCC